MYKGGILSNHSREIAFVLLYLFLELKYILRQKYRVFLVQKKSKVFNGRLFYLIFTYHLLASYVKCVFDFVSLFVIYTAMNPSISSFHFACHKKP